ncbi:uncharacterized protein LOC116308092 [Actinia tenebrosa]|uniref:Uncharacterized protein LOC116308092 n=1 Tax=Actinia tenebrosa TaxID=6105 RepID=A0A6P8J969_ACTTE|nr:uncharacterized protein LOC116308092 [Actinia tenebrosa]
MAVEEENKMLKAKIKEWKERWKEREKDEKRVLQGQRCLRQELSALQYRLGLRFFADDVKDIEKVKRKVMAEKEEQGRRSLRQELSALQYRLRLRFLTDDVEENNFNRQQDDDVVD